MAYGKKFVRHHNSHPVKVFEENRSLNVHYTLAVHQVKSHLHLIKLYFSTRCDEMCCVSNVFYMGGWFVFFFNRFLSLSPSRCFHLFRFTCLHCVDSCLCEQIPLTLLLNFIVFEMIFFLLLLLLPYVTDFHLFFCVDDAMQTLFVFFNMWSAMGTNSRIKIL